MLPFGGALDVAASLKWLAAHTTPGVDVVVGDSYRRATGDGVLHVRLGAVAATVSMLGTPRAPTPAELARLRFVLDLDRDIDAVGSALSGHRILGPLVAARPGLRVMGAWSPWEALIRVVLGQQVSVAGARTLAGRLVRTAGHHVRSTAGGAVATADRGPARSPEDAATDLLPDLGFPTPAELAAADLTAVGLTRARARTVTGLARAVDAGTLAAGPDEHPDAGQGWLDDLARQPGVGPWTVAYLAMRVLRDPDAWPAGDLVLRRACAAVGLDPVEAARDLRPWRAYAATHLWESVWMPAVAGVPGSAGTARPVRPGPR